MTTIRLAKAERQPERPRKHAFHTFSGVELRGIRGPWGVQPGDKIEVVARRERTENGETVIDLDIVWEYPCDCGPEATTA